MDYGLAWIDHSIWLFKSSQPARHVFSQHWGDCSSQASQLGTSSVNTGLIVQVKPARSARLHLRPCVQYGRSVRLDSTRLVRMSGTFSPRAAVQKADNQWDALDHNLMGFEWSEKCPLDQHVDDYKRGHLDGWRGRFKKKKQCNIHLLLKSALETPPWTFHWAAHLLYFNLCLHSWTVTDISITKVYNIKNPSLYV